MTILLSWSINLEWLIATFVYFLVTSFIVTGALTTTLNQTGKYLIVWITSQSSYIEDYKYSLRISIEKYLELIRVSMCECVRERIRKGMLVGEKKNSIQTIIIHLHVSTKELVLSILENSFFKMDQNCCFSKGIITKMVGICIKGSYVNRG